MNVEDLKIPVGAPPPDVELLDIVFLILTLVPAFGATFCKWRLAQIRTESGVKIWIDGVPQSIKLSVIMFLWYLPVVNIPGLHNKRYQWFVKLNNSFLILFVLTIVAAFLIVEIGRN